MGIPGTGGTYENPIERSYTYNAQGLPHLITDTGFTAEEGLVSRTSTINYSANALDVTNVVDAKGETVYTVNSYDTYHRPTSLTDGLGHNTELAYTSWGAPSTLTTHETENSTTHVVTCNYGTDHRLSNIQRDSMTLTSYTYDDIGRVRTITRANGITLTYSYNNLDKVTRVTYPDGTYEEIQYFCCGLPGLKRDRAGRITYYDYDALKRLIRVQDPAGNTLQYDYDEDGNLVRMLDAKGNATRWSYDGNNRMTQKLYADGRAESYTYYPTSDFLESVTNGRGRTTHYTYDEFGQLAGINYPNDPDVSFKRDELGRIISMTDGIGTTTYTYNVLRQMTSTDGPWSNDTLTYTYDSLNRPSSLSMQRGASAGTTDNVGYGYDGLNRLVNLTANIGGASIGTWNFSYSATTQRFSQLTAPNGTKTSYSYDYGASGLGELTQVENLTSTNALISRYSYGYDSPHEGLRVSQTREVAGEPAQTINYSYDLENQLTGEVSTEITPVLNQAYAYDTMGNRTSVQNQSGGTALSVAYTSNALNQYTGSSLSNAGTLVASTSYGYDADGNLTAQGAGAGGGTYTYDDVGRLTCVVVRDVSTGANLTKSCFSYDGQSRKRADQEYTWNAGTSAWDLQSEKRYVYNGMDVVQERDSSNAVTASLVRDGNIHGILARTKSDGTFFYHYDGNGNVCQLTDETQAIVAKYSYDAYGSASVSGTQGPLNPYRYSTKEFETASGLYDYGLRFYAPSLGGWINRDPIRESGGINLYSFVGNNPVQRSDARGLEFDEDDIEDDFPEEDPYEEWKLGIVDHTDDPRPWYSINDDGEITVIGEYRPSEVAASFDEYNQELGRRAACQHATEYFDELQRKGLVPGPYAGPSIPLENGPSRNFTPAEREAINQIGDSYGCHICGTFNPGTRSGNWVIDHQPGNAWANGEPQRGYPSCLGCSNRQGGFANHAFGW